MKECQGCRKNKPLNEYPNRGDGSGRLRPYCHLCSRDIIKARYRAHKNNSPFIWKCTKIKSSAKSRNLPFDLTPEYLESIWSGVCPITNVNLVWDADRSNPFGAELDRIIPSKGYVKGNVAFISRRMNKIKSDATSEELIKLGEWIASHTN